MEIEDIDKIAEIGFTPFGPVEELNEEQILDDQIFQHLFSIENLIARERLLAKLLKRVKELKVSTKIFNNIYKQYKESYIKSIKSEKSNVTNFSECEYKWKDKDGKEISQLNCGNWIADDTGIYKIEYNANMQPIKVKASPIPVIPVERLVNIDNNTEKVKLAFFKDGKWSEIIVEKNTIASKTKIMQLPNRGLELTDDNAKNLVNYFADIFELNTFIPKKGITHLGWLNKDFVPYTDNYIFDGNFKFKDTFESVAMKGDYEEWKEYVRDLRKNKTVRFIIDASFASPLVKLYNINSFIVHLWGNTEGGKTVSQMVAASIWGNPAKGKLLSTLNATSVAAERILSFLRNLPFIPDELQTIKSMYKNDFSAMIYNFTEGKGKDRGTIDGGLAEGTEWDNITILSGEEPITGASDKEGVKNRVIEIEENNKIIKKAGNDIVNFIYKNHGYAGKEFVEIIKNMSNEELYELRNNYVRELGKITKYEKQNNAMSVILVADYIVSKHIFNEEPLTADDVKKYFRNDSDEADRVIEIILDIANTNINNFSDFSKNYQPTGQTWGEIDRAKDGNNGTIFYYNFIPNVLYEELQKRNINWNSIKKKLADKEYIERQKNGEYTVPIRVNGGMQRYIKVKNIYQRTENSEMSG